MEEVRKIRKVIHYKPVNRLSKKLLLKLQKKYEHIFELNKYGLAAVEINNKFGLINNEGKEIIPCMYDFIYAFNDYAIANVEKNGKYGLININGEEITSSKYDDIYPFNDYGLANIVLNFKYGLIDAEGKEVVPCTYNYISEFNKYGIAKLRLNNKCGFINIKGELFPVCLDGANKYNEEGLVKVKKDDKEFYLDTNFQPVIVEEKEIFNFRECDNFTKEQDYGYMTITDKNEILIETTKEYEKRLSKKK